MGFAPYAWVACLLLGGCGFAAIAADPAGTGTIKELSLEEAKRLGQEQRGKLLLDSLTTLPDDVAREIAKREGWLSLNGLTTLSNGAAEALGGQKGYLFLDGLTSLSNEAAASLAKHGGYLSLDGIKTLSDEAAKPLLQMAGAGGHLYTRGGLSLRGLTTLSPEAAKALAARKGSEVVLDGLTTLSTETATVLATVGGQQWNGSLPKITAVSDEAAQALAKRGVALPGLRELSPAAAAALAGKISGNLPGLTSLAPEVAAKLVAASREGFNFDGLQEMSEDLAKVLVTAQRGEVSLNGLKQLSAPAAGALAKLGDISLNGLTQIAPDALGKLAAEQGYPNQRNRVFLEGLTTLTDDSAAMLAAWPKWSGGLPRLKEISEPVAAAIGASRNWNGRLPAVKSISAGAARRLAERQGDLSLDGLGALPEDVAAALAGHRGGTLSLDGLKTISDAAAAALAAHEGRLSLDGLTSLSDAAAKSLAAHKGDWLWLDGLATVSPAAARAFAGATGTVSLCGIKPVKDEAIAVLRSSRRIDLPAAVRGSADATAAAPTDEKFVHAFLGKHCGECHGDEAEQPEGEFAIDKPWPSMAGIAGRVAYASILERLRSDDMPPPQVEKRPDPAESGRVIGWILGQLDTPLAGPLTPYAVKDRPADGNRLPHAILFGGPRGPSVPPPPRLWRLSPDAYSNWLQSTFKAGGQQPFVLTKDAGIKDFAAIYTPDEGASGLLLDNAAGLVEHQVKDNPVVNIKEKPEAAARNPWPNDARIQTCSPEEKKLLEEGLRVAGGGPFAAIMHPQVVPTRAELEAAIAHQFNWVLARAPDPAEVDSLVKLYEAVDRDGDHQLSGKTMLMAPLMTPEAVLRFEVGAGAEVRPGVHVLSPREIALAVSLAIGTKREPSLVQAANSGGLKTREDVAAQVRRMLDTQAIPKPRVLQFFREYFGYDRAPDIFKDEFPAYYGRRGRHYNAAGFVRKSDARVIAALGEDRQVLAQLLTGENAFDHGGELHDHVYRAAVGGDSSLFRTVQPGALIVSKGPVEGRIGLLMDPAWLIGWSTNFHTDPVRRGRWIREQLLGGRVPDLPINAAAMIPDDPHRTLRERQSVTRQAECWKCHYRMDDLGLPFEAYDHWGYPLDGGEEIVDLAAMEKAGNKGRILRNAPLDTTGLIAHSGDPSLDGPVRDAPEMLRRLAASERVRQVFVRHAFRFFTGRNETPGDAPTLQEADRAYVESDGSFKELMISLLSSESFLYRMADQSRKQPATR